MIIGIPKEIMHDEARVAATPEMVGKFVRDGFEVLVERHAETAPFIMTRITSRPVPGSSMVRRRSSTARR